MAEMPVSDQIIEIKRIFITDMTSVFQRIINNIIQLGQIYMEKANYNKRPG